MKKIITLALFCCVSVVVFAQADKSDYWEKVKSMKIAHITTEVGLTPEEAQAFWPVYNEMERTMMDAQSKVYKAYKEMVTAVSDKKSEEEIRKALHKYIEATKERDKMFATSVAKYEKILSDTKVAKLYIAEESFRRNQIRQLKKNNSCDAGKSSEGCK